MTDFFYSIEALIDMIIVFEDQEIDIESDDFFAVLESVTTADFWLVTQQTFTFDLFGEAFASVDFTVDELLVQYKLGGMLHVKGT